MAMSSVVYFHSVHTKPQLVFTIQRQKVCVMDLMDYRLGRLTGWRSEWAVAPDFSWPKKEATGDVAQYKYRAEELSRTDHRTGGGKRKLESRRAIARG